MKFLSLFPLVACISASQETLRGSVRELSPAIVLIEDGLCIVYDGAGGIVFSQGDLYAVNTSSGKGMASCTFCGVAPSPNGTAVRWDYESTGQKCCGFGVCTDKWFEVVSAAGCINTKCFAK